MKQIKIIILSWLVHHANRLGKNEYFYKIKNKIVRKYGTLIDYDVQFIEGKKCNSCNGTGLYSKHDHYNGWYKETCWNCYNGWYKRPVWVLLAKFSLGKYTFHQPFKRMYEKPDILKTNILGYVEHDKSKYSHFALTVLFLIYEKGYLKRWYNEVGIGWRSKWWLPRNWLRNLVHIIKHGKNSYPIRKIKQKIRIYKSETFDLDLPF